MTFAQWIKTFLEEKEIDLETIIEAEGPEWGTNYIPVGSLVELMISAPPHERKAIKTKIVEIDFYNGDVLDFFKHLAHAVAT